MLSSTKQLKKIDDRLFHEERDGDGRPFEWRKEHRLLRMELSDVRLVEGFELEIKGVGGIIAAKADSESTLSTLKANARFEWKQSICLIDAESGERATYQSASVMIKPHPNWSGVEEKDYLKVGGKGGDLLHICDEMLNYDDKTAPCLHFDLYIPPERFALLAERPLVTQGTKVRLGVWVDVFRSEVDRALAEPHQHQDFYIERDSSNLAFVKEVLFESNIAAPTTPESNESESDLDDEPSEPPREEDRQASPINPALGTAAQLRGIGTTLKVIAGVAVLLLFAVAIL